ncbi:MAG: flagellar hook-associated protein FlgK [Methylohalobius sp.]|nr:flagellar hook-associated protein FlgK [Methylohalobius sp.]
MTTQLLTTATSGLRFSQLALDTTSHNIANVNTEGYSRQRVEGVTHQPLFVGAGFLGTGVKADAIRRIYDQFLDTQVRTATSSASEAEHYLRLTGQIDNIIADPDAGLASALANFFNAVHDAASDPTSIPARQALLSEAQTLTDRFNGLDARLREINRQVFKDLENASQDVNAIAEQIAELNRRIVAKAGQGTPNDLLDQRDRLIIQLAEKIRVSQVVHANGAVSLFMGTGQALVQDVHANALSVRPSILNPEQPEIILTTPAGSITITRQIQGGELGGALRFLREGLEPTRAKLGQLAAGLALEFNTLHRTGYDLNSNAGQDFFASLSVPVTQTGPGTIAVSYTAAQDLQPSDYLLEFDGTHYTLTRLSDRTQTVLSSFPATIDGLEITFPTPPSGPASFLIRPTAEAAADLQLAVSDPRQVALAKTPGAIGDNRVGLELAALESQKFLLGGTATLTEAYQQMVAEVGTLTRSARIAQAAQNTLKQQAVQAREAISGVNLDEEAANLVRFQQAYQAAAHVVTVAQQTFDTLINAIRR